MAKTKSNKRQWRGSMITGLIIVGIAAAIILLQTQGDSAPASGEPPQMTLAPQIAANLTQMPVAAPLSGDAADRVNQLKQLVDSCPDYVPERRSQMEQHIAWLLQPATIPPQMIVALGANPPGKLVFGMATYTSIQWRLIDRPTNSCLLPIGRMLNEMLVAAGEEPFPVFDELQ